MARRPSRWVLITGICLTGTLATAATADDSSLLEPVPAVSSDTADAAPEAVADTDKDAAKETKPADAKSGPTPTVAEAEKPATEPAPLPSVTSTRTSEKSDVEVVRERFPNGKVKIERETIRDAEDNYVNHGQWKMWDATGNVVGEGRYVNGQRQGTWTAWMFANEASMLAEMPYKQSQGPFISQAEFDNGKLNGTWTIFDSKHRKISEWGYSEGQRHGMWTSWYANGRKMREVSYAHGELDGDVCEWSQDGVQVTKDVYQQGRKLARKMEYHTDKQKKSEGVYLFAKQELQQDDDYWEMKLAKFVVVGKDERHGEWTAWHSTGQMQMQGHYEHDAPVGEFTWWFANGQKSVQGTFVHGQRNGEWTWYHQSGQKSTHGDFVMGGPNGRWIWWGENGKVAQKVEYQPGKDEPVKSIVKKADGAAGATANSPPKATGDKDAAKSREELELVPQSAEAPKGPVQR